MFSLSAGPTRRYSAEGQGCWAWQITIIETARVQGQFRQSTSTMLRIGTSKLKPVSELSTGQLSGEAASKAGGP